MYIYKYIYHKHTHLLICFVQASLKDLSDSWYHLYKASISRV